MEQSSSKQCLMASITRTIQYWWRDLNLLEKIRKMEANEPLFEQNVNQQQRLGHLVNVTRTCWFASINMLKCMINLPGCVGGRVTQVPVRFCSDPSTNVIDRSGKLWNGRTLETLSNESGIIWNLWVRFLDMGDQEGVRVWRSEIWSGAHKHTQFCQHRCFYCRDFVTVVWWLEA